MDPWVDSRVGTAEPGRKSLGAPNILDNSTPQIDTI